MSILPPLPPSTLLVAGKTLLFLPSLVKAIGVNEAIVLQQLRYQLADERAPHILDGRRWARASVLTWRERDFPFWSIKTVQRTFDSLERLNLIHSIQPDIARRDGTKWYTINFAAVEPLAKLIAGRRPGQGGKKDTVRPHEHALPPLPASNLLLAEPPLIILVDLAVRFGVDEAIILQQLRYWLADERKPPIREGQRWVCPRDIDFFEPITHRSPAVLEKIFRRLELAGLVRASARFNTLPGDRTKWYTLNFEALEQTPAIVRKSPPQHQADDLSKSKQMICPSPKDSIVQSQADEMSPSNATKCLLPSGSIDQPQADDLANCLKGSETDPQTHSQTQQQHRNNGVVVIAMEQALCERKITPAVAKRLCATVAESTIARQIEIYDWLNDQQIQPHQATPGRLRRMIEEDWQPPHEYRPAFVWEREAALNTTIAASRSAHITEAAREVRTLQEERHAIVEELGLNGDDQRRWSNIVAGPPVLPSPFREAFFYAPTPGSGEPGVIIFSDGESKQRALGASHRATRATVAARLALAYRYPHVHLEYVALAELRAAMHRPDDER